MRQLALSLPTTWGGRRPGAGRKPRGPRPNVSHRTRPYHDAAHPVHVTLRAVTGLASLRAPRVFPAVREALRLAQRERFRVCHFSVQSNHVHMLVEAKDRQAMSRGLQGLAIRLARAVNRVSRRKGKVWGDRFHARALATPHEVRNAIRYVLENIRKHVPGFLGVDPCSSAAVASRNAVTAARTWLLGAGWRRATPPARSACQKLQLATSTRIKSR